MRFVQHIFVSKPEHFVRNIRYIEYISQCRILQKFINSFNRLVIFHRGSLSKFRDYILYESNDDLTPFVRMMEYMLFHLQDKTDRAFCRRWYNVLKSSI